MIGRIIQYIQWFSDVGLSVLNCLKVRPTLTIFTYHDVGGANTALSVSPDVFLEHLQFFYENHISVLSLDEVEDIARGAKKLSRDSVLITFDDGYCGVLQHALPLLAKFSYPSVVFINPGHVGQRAAFATHHNDTERMLMNTEELAICAQKEMTVANHGWYHTPLTTKNVNFVTREIADAREWLKTHVPKSRGDVFAYPKGRVDNPNVVEQAGVVLAFNGGERAVAKRDSHLKLPRVTVYPQTSTQKIGASMNPLYTFLRNHRGIIIVCCVLALLRFSSGLFLFHDIPPIGITDDFSAINAGGDAGNYLREANQFSEGIFTESRELIGYPVFLAALFKIGVSPDNLNRVNALVLSTLGVVLAALTVYVLFGNVGYALVAGIVFIGIPYIWYFLFRDFILVGPFGTELFGMNRAQQLFWLPVLSDYLSSIFMYGGVAIAVAARLWSNVTTWRWALVGALFGIATMIRAQSIIPAVWMAVALLVPLLPFKPVLRRLCAYGGGFLVGVSPQLLHNILISGSPFVFSIYTQAGNAAYTDATYSLSNIVKAWTLLVDFWSPLILVPVGILGLTVLVVWYFRSDLYRMVLLLSVGIASPMTLFVFEHTIRNPRYFIPYLSIFITFGVVFFDGIVAILFKEHRAEMSARIIRYAVTSLIIIGTLYLSTILFVEVLHWKPVFAYPLTLAFGYFLVYVSNLFVVFQKKHSWRYMRSFLIYLVIFWAFNYLFFYIFETVFNINYIMVMTLNLLIFWVLRFAAMNLFVFKD